MKKRIVKALFFVLTAVLAFFCCMAVDCSLPNPKYEHDCWFDVNAEELWQQNNSSAHEIEAEMDDWAKGVTAEEGKTVTPVIKTYVMTYQYVVKEEIVIGPNMYVGICVNAAELDMNGYNVKLTYDENGQPISGFYVYNCGDHGCYESMEVVKCLPEEFIEMSYQKALAKGETSYTIPSGNYYYNEAFALSAWVNSGKVKFANAYATAICTNNYSGSFNVAAEADALRAMGVTVYTKCDEDFVDNSVHTCTYIPRLDLNSVPVTQTAFDQMMAYVQQNPAALQPTLTTEKGGFAFFHLAEDVSSTATFTVPENMYVGICTNGFEFDAPNVENVYVFDCVPHVCMADNCEEYIPLYNEGLAFVSKLYTAVYNKALELPAGNYACMENFDLANIPVVLNPTAEYNFCVNGFEVINTEAFASANISVVDCTKPEEYMHVCDALSPHITAAYLTEEILMGAVDANGNLTIGEGEVAFAMTTDFVIGGPLTIPTGTILHLCLNGYTIYGTPELTTNAEAPYMFIVEYGAELHICDCSENKTGALISATEEVMTQESFNVFSSVVMNVGKTTLSGVTLQGGMAVYNAGHLVVEDSTLNGLCVGIGLIPASSKAYPLQTKSPTSTVTNSTVNGTFMSIMALTGAMDLTDTSINSQTCGIFNVASLISLGEDVNGVSGEITIDNVVINLQQGESQVLNPIVTLLSRELEACIGLIAAEDLNLEGDLVINMDESLLEPFINDEGETVIPKKIEFVFTENGKINIEEGVVLTDVYETFFYFVEESDKDEFVIANKDIGENFILMEGVAGALNADGEYVVVLNSAFMDNAQVVDATVALDGYVSLDFTFQFDTNSDAPSFLENENAQIIFNIAGEKTIITPDEVTYVGNGEYLYRVDFYAQDYRDKISVQFTDGTYTWTGMTTVSVGTMLEYSLLNVELTIAEYEEIINFDAEEKAYYEQLQQDYPDDESFKNPTYTYSAEEVEMAVLYKEGYMAVKNAIVAMLNYCGAASAHFYEDAFWERDKTLILKNAVMVVDEETMEFTSEVIWEETTVASAMEEVTVATLADYRMEVVAGSKVPQGVTMVGASLVLDAGTDIRCYMRISASVMENLTFKVNGVEVEVVQYSGNLYYILIDNLAASELRNMYAISVTDGVDTFTLNYGVFSYMYGVLNNPDASEELVMVAKATWLYACEIENAFYAMGNLPSQDEVETQPENNGEVGSNDGL